MKNTKEEKQTKKAEVSADGRRIAAILIRGLVRVDKDIKDTLKMLRLYRKNACVVVEKNPSNLGMIIKCKDFITYGEIDDDTYKSLVEKRSTEYKGRTEDSNGKIKYKRFIELGGKKIKKYFFLNSPKGGFERKGIKTPYGNGGVLGYRGEKINDLIRKML